MKNVQDLPDRNPENEEIEAIEKMMAECRVESATGMSLDQLKQTLLTMPSHREKSQFLNRLALVVR